MTSFSERLQQAIFDKKNPVLVGLDPRRDQLPDVFQNEIRDSNSLSEIADVYRKFCQTVIDVVAPLVPAVKPQMAFFEQLGPSGLVALEQIMRYARQKGLLVLLDGKRNDIGSTAVAYAKGYFGEGSLQPWGADALTVSPYLGDDSLTPFVETAEKNAAGVFILVKTSNPGGAMIQDLIADGMPVYRHVAQYVETLSAESQAKIAMTADTTARKTCAYGNIGAVVGATWPRQLAELREAMPTSWFLVPGYGSQGGSAKDVAPAFDEQGLGAVINNSRGIIFAFRKDEYKEKFGQKYWEKAVEASACQMIEALKEETSVAQLG